MKLEDKFVIFVTIVYIFLRQRGKFKISVFAFIVKQLDLLYVLKYNTIQLQTKYMRIKRPDNRYF